MLKRLFLSLLFSLSLLACRESEVEELKNFRIFVNTDTPALKYSVQILVRDYNRRVGSEVLTVVDTKDASNSQIHFKKDLVHEGRKLGLGQWTMLQKQTVHGAFSQYETTTIEYGMELIFDRDNFESKAAYVQDPESDQYKHLFHLFCHEVGHGMQMDHNHDEDSVMYPSIAEKGARPVDYDRYFQNIRHFLANPEIAMERPEHHRYDEDFGLSDEHKL